MRIPAPVFATEPLTPLPTDRTVLMGIVNVTPDSFSDGGKWFSVEAAIARAEELVAARADIIDVGGESTRPGSTRLGADEELERILEVVEALAERGIVVSVDTVNAATARAVVDAGAHIINDVSGGCWDPQMPAAMAETDAVCIIQHWRGFPGAPDEKILDIGCIDTVISELNQQINAVIAAGVKPERIIADPGLGFAKTNDASWDVLVHLERLKEQCQYPILIGHSRKRFVKELTDENISLDEVTTAVTTMVASRGVWGVRVHEANGNAAAIRTGMRWLRATIEGKENSRGEVQ